MTLADLVTRLERRFPDAGYLISSHVKRTRLGGLVRGVWYEAHLYPLNRTLEIPRASSPEEIWAQLRDYDKRIPWPSALARVNPEALALEDRA